MGLTSDLLTILSSYSGGYRLMRARLAGYPSRSRSTSNLGTSVSDAAVRVTLSRLKKKGFVEQKKGIWSITKEGTAHLFKKAPLPLHNRQLSSRKRRKNIIVIFDIPEASRRKRDWLRIELLSLGFAMLQKSVWLGPGPLPKEFADSLRELKLFQYLKFFEAKEADIV